MMFKSSYWSQDVCAMLKLTDSTLRRWCITMKKKGYVFETDDNGRRRFTEKDINAIRTIQTLSERPDVTIEQAIDSIITGTNIVYPAMNNERSNLSVQSNGELVEALAKLNDKTEQGFLSVAGDMGELRKMIEEQNNLIKRLESELAATREPIPGFFARLFGKK